MLHFVVFQYNCISLGFTVGAVAAILSGKDLVGSVLYCLALNHKQVSLLLHCIGLLFICFFTSSYSTRSMQSLYPTQVVILFNFFVCDHNVVMCFFLLKAFPSFCLPGPSFIYLCYLRYWQWSWDVNWWDHVDHSSFFFVNSYNSLINLYVLIYFLAYTLVWIK